MGFCIEETKVYIEESVSVYIERLYFEYEAGKANIAFLMSQDNVKWDVLQHYVDIVEARYVELEKAKKSVTEEYMPEEFIGKDVRYEFLFEEHAILYKENIA